MNSDTYQHKQVTGDSHSTGEEMETGKDTNNVTHKHPLLIMAGSLLALLVWIATAGHSGGAGGGQYVTAAADDMTQEGGGALAAEYQGETVKSGVLTKDIFSLGSEVGDEHGDYCGPDCIALVAKVNVGSTPWCDRSSFKLVNGIEYCFAPCNTKKYSCDTGSLSGMGLTSAVTLMSWTRDQRIHCEQEYCGTGYGGAYGYGYTDVCPSGGKWDYSSYLCQKCPKITVPAPGYGGATWCENGGPYYVGQDGKQYCWSTCAAIAGNRNCAYKKDFWRLSTCQHHRCPGSQHADLCQLS